MTTSLSTTAPAAMAEAATAVPAPIVSEPNARLERAGSLVLSKGKMVSGMGALQDGDQPGDGSGDSRTPVDWLYSTMS